MSSARAIVCNPERGWNELVHDMSVLRKETCLERTRPWSDGNMGAFDPSSPSEPSSPHRYGVLR